MGLKERIFGKNDSKDYEFSATAAHTDLANPSNSSPQQEYIDTVGKIGYLLDSAEMQQFFANNKQFSPLIPAFQSVVRTTKINSHEAQMMWLGYKILSLKLKADLASKFPQVDYSAIFMSLELLYESIISDAKDGWKGHLTTEQVRRLDVVLNKKDHGR